MAIQYSIQKMVSDGTLSTIALGIQYLQRNDIYIRIAGEETPQSGAPSGYTWSFLDNTTLKILPVVPNGVEVVVYRRTDVDAMYNVYSQNAQFDESTIDENNQQLLYIAQEYLEQGLPGAGVDTLEYVRDDGSFTYYRIKRTDGSYSEEFAVPSASSSTKVLAREALRRSYAEAGYNLVDGSFEAGGTLVKASDVLLYEVDGKTYSGGGTLPKTVPPGSTPASTGGISPTGWLDIGAHISRDSSTSDYGRLNASTRARLAKRGARVVLVGDSLSSFYNIDSVNFTGLFESHLRRRFMELNPSIQFFNRAIGGMRYYDLGKPDPALTSPSSGYPWYDNFTKRWMEYVKDTNPDVVVLAFGMNDGSGWSAGNFQQDNFQTMMDDLRNLPSRPEIVFCTNILPSTENPATSSDAAQSGRDAMAGWTRSYAKFMGFSYVDLHRRFRMLRDGVDPCVLHYARKTIQRVVTLPWDYTDLACDSYSARVTLIDPVVATSGIQFQLSAYANNFLSLKYNGSLWETTVYTASNATVGAFCRHLAAGNAPTTDTKIHFILNGSVVTIFVDDNTEPVFSANVVRFGGVFVPKIGGSGSIKVDLMAGVMLPYKASMTDADIYSPGSVDGGNDINHPTAKASSAIYGRVLDSVFNASGVTPTGFDVSVDFRSGKVRVDSLKAPDLSADMKLSDALTFIAGSLQFSRDSEGRVLGAIFGATNRAYMDGAKFFNWGGVCTSVDMEVDFIAPSGQAYTATLGEGTSGDRLHLQVTSDLRHRGTLSSTGGSSDLFTSATWPLIAGKLANVRYHLTASSIATIGESDGFRRGNINTHTVTGIAPAMFTKLKFGYASTGTFGADVVISAVRLKFR